MVAAAYDLSLSYPRHTFESVKQIHERIVAEIGGIVHAVFGIQRHYFQNGGRKVVSTVTPYCRTISGSMGVAA